MKTKINKKEMLIWFGILGTIIIICSNFLQMHFSSDTYVLIKLGYFDYPSEYFLKDGRIISTLFCYLGGFLHLPIPIYIIGMDLLGMIFLSISVYITARIFINIIKPENTKKRVLIYLASFILIVNQYTLELLLFPESGVMCLGLLFAVLGLKCYTSDEKNKTLGVLLYYILTALTYQGILNVLPILLLLVIIIQQIKEKNKLSKFILHLIIEILKIVIMIIIGLSISIGIIKICRNIYGQDKISFYITNNSHLIQIKKTKVLKHSKEIIIDCMNMFPKYSIVICFITALILLILMKAKWTTILNYIIIVLSSVCVVVLPLFIVTANVCARLSLPVMMIFGISLLILIASIRENEKKLIENLITIIVVFVFILNAGYIIRNTAEHIAANKVDENDGMQIKYMIDEYEKTTGNKVTKFGYMYDIHPQQFANGIADMQSLTERKFSCYWCILYAMDYYCERDFSIVNYDFTLGNTKKDYSNFSSEQISFKDDTIYMIIY